LKGFQKHSAIGVTFKEQEFGRYRYW